MPYIKQEDRAGAYLAPRTVGELNYTITKIVQAYLDNLIYPIGSGHRYGDFNAAIGALECAKLELYRRMVAPYEDKKCAENGDVYP